MYKSFYIILFLVFFTACSSNKYPHLDTFKTVDIKKYKGVWYEIARFEHFFEKGCKNVTATYELQDDDTIKVINRCVNIDSNKEKEATGVAYPVDKTNAKLKVSFFRPFYGDYWIIDLGKNYEYVLVGTPSREYLWILSREKILDEKIIKKLVEKAAAAGFDTTQFIWTIQE